METKWIPSTVSLSDKKLYAGCVLSDAKRVESSVVVAYDEEKGDILISSSYSDEKLVFILKDFNEHSKPIKMYPKLLYNRNSKKSSDDFGNVRYEHDLFIYILFENKTVSKIVGAKIVKLHNVLAESLFVGEDTLYCSYDGSVYAYKNNRIVAKFSLDNWMFFLPQRMNILSICASESDLIVISRPGVLYRFDLYSRKLIQSYNFPIRGEINNVFTKIILLNNFSYLVVGVNYKNHKNAIFNFSFSDISMQVFGSARFENTIYDIDIINFEVYVYLYSPPGDSIVFVTYDLSCSPIESNKTFYAKSTVDYLSPVSCLFHEEGCIAYKVPSISDLTPSSAYFTNMCSDNRFSHVLENVAQDISDLAHLGHNIEIFVRNSIKDTVDTDFLRDYSSEKLFSSILSLLDTFKVDNNIVDNLFKKQRYVVTKSVFWENAVILWINRAWKYSLYIIAFVQATILSKNIDYLDFYCRLGTYHTEVFSFYNDLKRVFDSCISDVYFLDIEYNISTFMRDVKAQCQSLYGAGCFGTEINDSIFIHSGCFRRTPTEVETLMSGFIGMSGLYNDGNVNVFDSSARSVRERLEERNTVPFA